MHTLRAAAAIIAAGTVIVVIAVLSTGSRPPAPVATSPPVALPSPALRGQVSLEEALARRRSVREFAARPLSAAEIGQLLWAAQGVTDDAGRRTAPSAGATYPLELCAVTADGVYRYLPDEHALRLVQSGDIRTDLAAAAIGQSFVGEAPLTVVVAAVPARTEARYGARSGRYVALEAGHAAQNLLLQAVALDLVSVPIGSFDDAAVADLVGLGEDEMPLYLLPVGHPR